MPLLGGQGETAEVTFHAGGELGVGKVVVSPDGRFVTLSLNATFADLYIGKEGQIETETATDGLTVSLPAGHTVLLRTPFVKKRTVGIWTPGEPSSSGETTKHVGEKADPDAKPERYLYILVKPTIVAKSDGTPAFPILGEQ